ncbi:hypothetical protein BD414DRAFT_484630 [Trametes punicea]|nr:hypothetical protein BD414DRAFT_484630 [Trametes punicea]
MTVRPSKPNLVLAVRKRVGRDLTGEEMLRIARAMRIRQAQRRIYKPRMELWDDGESPTITAVFELPGLRADEILLDVLDGQLVVSGERRQRSLRLSSLGGQHGQTRPSAGSTSVALQVDELKYGTFRRAISVPAGCTTKDLETTLEDGMLTVCWPRHPSTEHPEPVADMPDTPESDGATSSRFGGPNGSRASY